MAVERIISNDLLVIAQGSGGVALKFKTVPKGEKGDTGPAGTTGARGATGATGATGPAGGNLGILDGGDADDIYGPGGIIDAGGA